MDGRGLIALWKVLSSPGVASWDHPPKQTECVCAGKLVCACGQTCEVAGHTMINANRNLGLRCQRILDFKSSLRLPLSLSHTFSSTPGFFVSRSLPASLEVIIRLSTPPTSRQIILLRLKCPLVSSLSSFPFSQLSSADAQRVAIPALRRTGGDLRKATAKSRGAEKVHEGHGESAVGGSAK